MTQEELYQTLSDQMQEALRQVRLMEPTPRFYAVLYLEDTATVAASADLGYILAVVRNQVNLIGNQMEATDEEDPSCQN